jgi:tetratricopeptide (TPR) repeat protein
MRRIAPQKLMPALLALTIAVAIGGCSRSTSPEAARAQAQQHIQRAESYRHQGQYGAAAIEARNAMKLAPGDSAGILELAGLMNDLGQGKQASKLLEPIAASGDKTVVLAAAEAYLIQRKFRSALDYLQAQAERLKLQQDSAVRLKIARAQLGLGQYDAAATEFNALRDIPAVSGAARLGLAELDLRRGDAEAGAAALQQLLQQQPANVDALLLAASLAERGGKLDQAEDMLSRALMNLPETDILLPQKITALQQLTTVLTKEGRTGEALVYAKTLADANPDSAHLEEQFKQGLKLFQDGKLAQAETVLTEVYQKSHNDLAGTLLGMIKYAQNDLSDAANYLDQHVDPETASDTALMALASTQLRLEQPAKLLELIGPEQRAHIKNPQLRALIGIALLQTGDIRAGDQMATAALAEQPENNVIRTALAQQYLKAKQPQKALALLQQGLAGSPHDAGLNRLYIDTNMALGKTQEALNAARQFAATEPAQAENYLLYGRIALLAKQFDSSRAALQKALTLRPDFAGAQLELARLALLQEQPQQAEALYKQVLAKNGDNVAAIRGFITTQEMIAGREQVAANIETLVLNADKSATARAVVAEYYIRNRQLDSARRLLDGLPATAADGYAAQVKQYYALARAEVALAAKDYAAARLATVDGLRVNPRSPGLLTMLAHIEIKAGKLKEAEKVIGQLAEVQPQAQALLSLRGELAAAGRRGAAATQDFRKLWDLTHSDVTAAQLYKNLEANNASAAVAFLNEWQSALPKSDRPYLIRAMQLQQKGDDAAALPLYEAALQRNGNNSTTLNNLAWLYFAKGDKRALALAEKAAQLAPQNPAVLDTYGWLLAENRQKQKGLEVLRRAAALAPNSKEIADHLAQLTDKP